VLPKIYSRFLSAKCVRCDFDLGRTRRQFYSRSTEVVVLKDPLRIVITDYGFPNLEVEQQIIESAGGELCKFQCKTEQDVIDAARNSDAILVQFAPITSSVIDQLGRCKVIVRYGVGTDNVDLDAARSRGIVVCNVPHYCIDEVADHTFALAMALARQVPTIDRELRSGLWNSTPRRSMLASRQMTFITIGFGRIARAVLERAKACQFDIATCDPYLSANVELPIGIQNLSMEQTLATADILISPCSTHRGYSPPDQCKCALRHETHEPAGQYRPRWTCRYHCPRRCTGQRPTRGCGSRCF
jgi:D-isomer specific 2-hydroxyacid dehydrogenase, catalytic domain/D-isomer specific 2-hydroxyacid dehydrogenase, NAD binding domain